MENPVEAAPSSPETEQPRAVGTRPSAPIKMRRIVAEEAQNVMVDSQIASQEDAPAPQSAELDSKESILDEQDGTANTSSSESTKTKAKKKK
jgi:hypothetical protein